MWAKIFFISLLLSITSPVFASIFYVDQTKGDDKNSGIISAPFQTLHRALKVVSDRVEHGIYSDTIFVRAGIYKSNKISTIYKLNLRGTRENYAMLSAMPAKPHAPNAVQRKSGRWYEKVVFDDGYEIKTRWKRLEENPLIWETKPDYTLLEWTHQNLWPWTSTKKGFPITDKDATPKTTLFTVAPYMLLQDGEPTLWVDYVNEIKKPGMRTFDHETGTLYVRPFGDKDPNSCKFESWYGGPEKYEPGTLFLDGEGRALFDGNLEYATIRGFEFRMLTKLFEFHRRGYKKEADRVTQRYVRFEDNYFQYCWIHIVLDGNTVLMRSDGKSIYPRYEDRSNWHVFNNVFYRPSREVCQLHGDDHVIEYNEIIDHNGPWAGPATCVSAINTRNTRNAIIRYNFINGHGNNKWHSGSVFMIEVSGRDHGNASGDYKLGGQTFEYNIIANVSSGPAMVLGKGGMRMRDITVRNNIFLTNHGGPAIRISSPHKNLIIEHNIFYDQAEAIQVFPKDNNPMQVPSLSNSIFISKNIFMKDEKTIDKRIFEGVSGSKVVMDSNLFYQIKEPVMWRDQILADAQFRDAENFDFRVRRGSPAIIHGDDIGAYDADRPAPAKTQWWLLKKKTPAILPIGKYIKR